MVNTQSESGRKVHEMLSVVGQKRNILIMCHNNPDPDTIASSAALKAIFAQSFRRKTVIGYEGIIGRAENRQLVRRLKIDMVAVKDFDFRDFSVICLVDSQPRTGNNAIPRNLMPHIVIDHHPLRKETAKCSFYDVRPRYGSSSTILTEYVRELGLEIDRKLATALFYGLKTDTYGLSRSSLKADLETFNYLFPKIAPRTLAAIENPSVPKSYYLKFADAIANSTQYNDVMISQMGTLTNPDIVAEMADFLLRMENIRWTLCMGEYKNDLILSVRTMRRGWIAGKIALRIVAGVGTGGGHEKAAGGKVPLSGFSQEERSQVMRKVIERFLDVVGAGDREGKPLITHPTGSIR